MGMLTYSTTRLRLPVHARSSIRSLCVRSVCPFTVSAVRCLRAHRCAAHGMPVRTPRAAVRPSPTPPFGPPQPSVLTPTAFGASKAISTKGHHGLSLQDTTSPVLVQRATHPHLCPTLSGFVETPATRERSRKPLRSDWISSTSAPRSPTATAPSHPVQHAKIQTTIIG